MMRSPVTVSRLPVGSSANSTVGLPTAARAIRHALLLAARELPRIMADARGEPDAREHLVRALAGVGSAAQFERQHDVFESRQRRHQVEGLEHEAHLFRPQPRATVLVECRQVRPRQPYLARADRIEAGEQCQQRGLAGAGRPGDRHALSRAYGK